MVARALFLSVAAFSAFVTQEKHHLLPLSGMTSFLNQQLCNNDEEVEEEEEGD